MQRSGIIAPGDGLEAVSRVAVGRFERGDCLIVFPAVGLYAGDATAYPAGSPVDGPYIRITPHWAGSENQGSLGDCKRMRGQQAVSGDRVAYVNAAGAQALLAVTGLGASLYYELDANAQLPIYMPFDASVDIVTSVSGAWIYNSRIFTPDFNPTRGGGTSPLYRHTRDIQAGQTRTLTVPLGATEWEVIAEDVTVPPTVTMVPDDQGARALVNQGAFGAGSGVLLGQRMSLANARQLVVTAGAASRVKVIFYIQLV